MNRQTLLRLYPHRWRDRYGDEFLALLEQQPVTPIVVLDVLLGALDAHLRAHVSPMTETVSELMMRQLLALRTTALTVFCAYITFVVAGFALLGMVDDSPFVPAMRDHFALNACWLIIEGGAAGALIMTVIGGLPIGLATLGYALAHKRRDILRLLCVPVLVLGADALAVGLLAAISFGWLPFPLVCWRCGVIHWMEAIGRFPLGARHRWRAGSSPPPFLSTRTVAGAASPYLQGWVSWKHTWGSMSRRRASMSRSMGARRGASPTTRKGSPRS